MPDARRGRLGPGALIAVRILFVAVAALAMSGCFLGNEFEDEMATPDQIKAAAARCGVSNFRPTKAGAGWAAYVDKSVPDSETKADCIYADLERQGLRTTR